MCTGAPGLSGHLIQGTPEMGNRRTHPTLVLRKAGGWERPWDDIQGTKKVMQPPPTPPRRSSNWPLGWASCSRAGFSIFGGREPCSPGRQALLESQSSGRHCAPVKVQGKLGGGGDGGKEKMKGEHLGHSTRPNQHPPIPRPERPELGIPTRRTVTVAAAPGTKPLAYIIQSSCNPTEQVFYCPHFTDEETEGQRDKLTRLRL